jgi:hypothetical protein
VNCPSCSALHLRKVKQGPLTGLFVCRCGTVAGPRPLAEAIRLGISLPLWSLIHSRIVDARATGYEAAVIRQVAVSQSQSVGA